jgi:hypothetical protein
VFSYVTGLMEGQYAELVNQGQAAVEGFELR